MGELSVPDSRGQVFAGRFSRGLSVGKSGLMVETFRPVHESDRDPEEFLYRSVGERLVAVYSPPAQPRLGPIEVFYRTMESELSPEQVRDGWFRAGLVSDDDDGFGVRVLGGDVLSVEEFWVWVDAFAGGQDMALVAEVLRQHGRREVEAFAQSLTEHMFELDRPELSVVTDGVRSLDASLDCRLAVILSGRSWFEAVLADPSLFDTSTEPAVEWDQFWLAVGTGEENGQYRRDLLITTPRVGLGVNETYWPVEDAPPSHDVFVPTDESRRREEILAVHSNHRAWVGCPTNVLDDDVLWDVDLEIWSRCCGIRLLTQVSETVYGEQMLVLTLVGKDHASVWNNRPAVVRILKSIAHEAARSRDETLVDTEFFLNSGGWRLNDSRAYRIRRKTKLTPEQYIERYITNDTIT